TTRIVRVRAAAVVIGCQGYGAAVLHSPRRCGDSVQIGPVRSWSWWRHSNVTTRKPPMRSDRVRSWSARTAEGGTVVTTERAGFAAGAERGGDGGARSPVLAYLDGLLAEYGTLDDGEVATYIPELAKADPGWFGISVVTTDGHAYDVGDAAVPF